ncbi:MAG: DegV family protein [Clostridia bacterium]|nr:DegV family protein [Clostridia bacterium]
MENFIISTETTCDLSSQTLSDLDVSAISMEYSVGGEIFGGDSKNTISNKDFYAKMRKGAKTHTSMINDERAKNYLLSLLSRNTDVLHISFASVCSGTCDAFLRASKEINATSKNKVYVVDSKCESTAQGLLVKLCAEKRKSGASLSETKEYCEAVLSKINSLFTVDNLKYLEAGGRISKSTAIIGNVLSVKPILYVDETGKLTQGGKVISRKLSLSKLAKLTSEKFSGECNQICVSHADCTIDCNFVVKKLQSLLPSAQIFTEEIGPVIGAHSGPSTIAVFFVGKDRSFS